MGHSGLLAAVPGAYLLHIALVVELGVDLLADKLGVNLGIVVILGVVLGVDHRPTEPWC